MLISIILFVAGIASLVYFAGYAAFVGINNSFLFFWVILGIFCIAWAGVHRQIWLKGMTSLKKWEQVFGVMLLAVLIVFLATLVILVREGHTKPENGADYVIVLGAHVYGERMSMNLAKRVEKAEEYLRENPETQVILSGGRGKGEKISEAEAMRRYLVEKGISMDRILMDETSVNTDENIKNSKRLMKNTDCRVVIVSNAFHIYRARGIARKQGLSKVEGLSSAIHPYTIPNSYVREVFAVWKYKIFGQLG